MESSRERAATYDISDVDYLRHGTTDYQARVYRPRGAGPFPAIVDVHGGAWTVGDRMQCEPIQRVLASNGIVVFSLDFRLPSAAVYPGPVADINYGIRYFKANAERFGTRADLVGAFGSSSGGHQLLLNVLRPADPRYTAIPLAGLKASIRASRLRSSAGRSAIHTHATG